MSVTFVITKSLNIDAIPCKIAIGSFPLFIRLLQTFKIEFGSLVIKDFAKEHDALKAISLALSGQLLPASDLKKLAELPTHDQARAMLLGLLVTPMMQLARTLNETPAMLARTLSARSVQAE